MLEVRKTKFESGNATVTPIGNRMRTEGNEATVRAARGPFCVSSSMEVPQGQSKEPGCQEEGFYR